MFDMKPKSLILLAGGLLGLGALTLVADQKRRSIRQTERDNQIKTIRQELSHLGEIAVLYVDPFSKENPALTGGVVLEDGRNYRFCQDDGALTYEEDPA